MYEGILNLHTTRQRHAAAVKELTHSKLTTPAETFAFKHELDDFSHRVIAVYPVKFSASYDRWAIDFKSIRIAR